MDTTTLNQNHEEEDGHKLEESNQGAMPVDFFSLVAHEVTVIADEYEEESLQKLENKNSIHLELNLSKNSQSPTDVNSSNKEQLNNQKSFPANTKIIDYKSLSDNNYTASLRLKCCSKEDFKTWLAEFERLSCNNYRVANTGPTIGKTVVYKAIYRCQHNTYPGSHRGRVKTPSKKHTGCGAKIKVAIKSSVKGRRVRSKDYLRADYPTVVNISHQHNHNIGTADVIKFRDPTEEIRKKFIELFNNHHTPAKALEIHKRDLLEKYEDDFHKVIVDRSICPDISWVYRLYYSVIKKPKNTTETNDNSEGASYNQTIIVEHKRQIELQLDANEKQINWEDYKKKWGEVTSILKEKFAKNPSDTACAMDSMMSKFTSIETDSLLMSAMHNFGNFQYEAIIDDQKGTNIPVEVSAISRKKIAVGARRRQQSDRKANCSYASEHSYVKLKKEFKKSPSKSQKADVYLLLGGRLHCLQECVDET